MKRGKFTLLRALASDLHVDGKELTSEVLYELMRPHYIKYDNDPKNREERLKTLHEKVRRDLTNEGKITLNAFLGGQALFDFEIPEVLTALRESIVAIGENGVTMSCAALRDQDLVALDECEKGNRDEVVLAYERHHQGRNNTLKGLRKFGAANLGELVTKGWRPPSAN